VFIAALFKIARTWTQPVPINRGMDTEAFTLITRAQECFFQKKEVLGTGPEAQPLTLVLLLAACLLKAIYLFVSIVKWGDECSLYLPEGKN